MVGSIEEQLPQRLLVRHVPREFGQTHAQVIGHFVQAQRIPSGNCSSTQRRIEDVCWHQHWRGATRHLEHRRLSACSTLLLAAFAVARLACPGGRSRFGPALCAGRGPLIT